MSTHFFGHFWISQKVGGVRHCQDGDDQEALQKPIGDVTETTSIFYTVYATKKQKILTLKEAFEEVMTTRGSKLK